MGRGQLDAEKDGAEVVKGFLEKAIELNRSDTFAWEQLGRVYVEVRRIHESSYVVVFADRYRVYCVPLFGLGLRSSHGNSRV